MKYFNPALVSISFRKLSPLEIISGLKNSPVKGIEWGGDVHVPHGDIATAKLVGNQTRDAGLEPFCYGSYYRFLDVLPEHQETGPEIEAVFDTAEALGARRIRVWVGKIDFEEASTAYRSTVIERAKEIGILAHARDMEIDFEFHGGTLNNSAANAIRLLKSINHPRIHTLWQPAVSLSVEERVEGIQELLPHISNIHCFHWGPGGFQDRRALAEGVEEWGRYLQAIKDSKQPRWVSLEYVQNDSLESLRRDSFTLKHLIDSLSS